MVIKKKNEILDNSINSLDMSFYEGKTIEELIEESKSYTGTWTAKPKELLMPNIRKLEKIRENVEFEEVVKDLEHRKFKVTLLPTQILNSFKKGVRKGEYDKDTLITIFRVIAQTIYNDPSLSDKNVVDMFNVTKVKAGEYYERRSKSIRSRGK